MKKLSFKIFIVLGVVAVLALGFMFCPYFYITTINVSGNGIVSYDEIVSSSELNTGTSNLYMFNAFSAEKKLLKNPYIKSVEFIRTFPNTLKISVVERKPYGYIPYTNTFLFMDDEGRILDSKSSYTNPLPVVRGLNFSSFSIGEKLVVDPPEKLDIVVNLSKLMDTYQIIDQVVNVDVSKIDDIHLHINNIDVVLGEFTDENWKISALSEIIKKLSPDDKGILDISSKDGTPTFTYLT